MKIVNRQAKFDYAIQERVEAGVVLTGAEAKSAHQGQVDMGGAHVKIRDGQAEIVNLKISPYRFAQQEGYDPGRARALLLKKSQIVALGTKMRQKRLVLVPTALYSRRNKIKVELGLGRGKRVHEKREAIKRRDWEREN